MNKNVTNVITNPMSDVLMDKYLDGDANIVELKDISNMDSINSVFKNKYKHVIIFIAMKEQNIGHWVCMFLNKDDELLYFDSYGEKPLIYLETVNQDGTGQTDKLLELIRNSKYKDKFYYNSYQYQKDGRDIATCGRHVLTALILNRLHRDANKYFDFHLYNKIMISWKNTYKKNYDEIVSFFIDELE